MLAVGGDWAEWIVLCGQQQLQGVFTLRTPASEWSGHHLRFSARTVHLVHRLWLLHLCTFLMALVYHSQISH